MSRRVKTVGLALMLALAGCGSQRELTPLAGHELPPPPYGSSTRQTAAELLKPSAQAMPVRADELRTRSEERADDPFDLPPATKPRAAKP